MLLAETPEELGGGPQVVPSIDPIVIIELANQDDLAREPPIGISFKNDDDSHINNNNNNNGNSNGPNRREPKILPILDYYLTFIHYFGFSINPNDDTSSRILSIRVKRAAAFATSLAKQCQLQQHHQQPRQQHSHSQCSSCHSGSDSTAATSGQQQHLNQQQQNQKQQQPQSIRKPSLKSPRSWRALDGRAAKSGIKLVAISLTTFLTMNHVIVLVDYVYQGSKVLTELMLELRLVITKLSALIFVISWHRNQSEVRQLIRLIKSTSVNILTSEQNGAGGGSVLGASSDKRKQSATTQPGQSSDVTRAGSGPNGGGASQSHHQCARLNEMNWRILRWWIACTIITITHLSLSEAEIKSAHHLWEWLDDYSLHQLSNQTTSNETLFAMATFDNYMYTVHVYGTRLIGSSIICIVCAFQIENITCLTRQTLNLLQAYASTTPPMQQSQSQSRGCASDAAAGGCWPGGVWRGGCDCEHEHKSNTPAQNGHVNTSGGLFCRSLFYVLGESDWLGVERNRENLEPIGRLSWPLACAWSRALSWLRKLVNPKHCLRACVAWAAALASRDLLGRCWPVIAARLSRRIPFNRVTPFWWLWGAPGLGSSDCCDDGNSTISPRPPPDVDRPGAASMAANPSLKEPTPSGLFNQRLHIDRGGGNGNSNSNVSTTSMTSKANNNNRTSTAASSHRHNEQAPIPILRNYLDDYLARERSLATNGTPSNRHSSHGPGGPSNQCNMISAGGEWHDPGHEIELQLDNLARKYELIRTVNLRIDNCFGHMLLSQYSFLFLMSCIDVVFFSLSFSPNTKTKYIIVSGMILLWLPYLLLYKYASDVGLASKKLLKSVRRLARLAFVLRLSRARRQQPLGGPQVQVQQAQTTGRQDHDYLRPPFLEKAAAEEELFLGQRWSHLARQHSMRSISAVGKRLWERRQLRQQQQPPQQRRASSPQPVVGPEPCQSANPIMCPSHSSRARIFNKLDHVFEPSHLSIVGLMTMNKFFLLNFAKIVITASVMTIQFISKR